jgi:TolB-like protein
VVVEGSVQKSGDRLRASLRMTDVHSGKLIWAADFDVPASDPLQAQASLARDATAEISRRLAVTR